VRRRWFARSAGEPADRDAGDPLRRIEQEPEPAQAADQLGEGHLGLEARQRRADAVMDAVPEGEVLCAFTRDVEAIRIREH